MSDSGPMARAQDPWSNIPLDLAGLVLKRLPAHVDRVRFAAVCPQWRSAARQVKLPSPMPLLSLKDGDIFYSMPRGEALPFSGCIKGHLDGCNDGFNTACGNWLVYMRWGFSDLLLLDPFSGATMTLPGPSSFHLPDEEEGEDSMDGHDSAGDEEDFEGGEDEGEDSMDGHDSAGDGEDSECGEDEGEDSMDGHDCAGDGEDSEGGHDSADDGDDSEDESVYRDISDAQIIDVENSDVIKLIVCSPNLIAALLKGENNWIAVCRPGGSKWSVAWGLSSLWITDVAFYQGKLYVVDYDEDLLALDISVDDNTGDPRVSQIRRVINVGHHFDDQRTMLRMLYLVESCGSLLLVLRRIFHTHVHDDGQIHTFAGQCEPDLSIFEADFVQSQWTKVTSLGDDQVLFLGPCSKAVCMPQGDSPGNRVWFLDDYKDFHVWHERRRSLSSDTSSVANPKPFSPLPMISWRGYLGNAGAAWIFPAN